MLRNSGAQNRSLHALWQKLRLLENRWHPPVGGWQTPDAPNNIIHVRLATGSVVEQMNAHPFAKLHTALTHNGETTNYEALKQRVEQFNLSPLATTDTEVASLKFDLTASNKARMILMPCQSIIKAHGSRGWLATKCSHPIIYSMKLDLMGILL